MKVTTTLMGTAEEQMAQGDALIVDPAAAVRSAPDRVPVYWNFNHQLPPLGWAGAFRVDEDGRLVADIEIKVPQDIRGFMFGTSFSPSVNGPVLWSCSMHQRDMAVDRDLDDA